MKITYKKAGNTGLSVLQDGKKVGRIKFLKERYVYLDERTGLPVKGLWDPSLMIVKLMVEAHLTKS